MRGPFPVGEGPRKLFPGKFFGRGTYNPGITGQAIHILGMTRERSAPGEEWTMAKERGKTQAEHLLAGLAETGRALAAARTGFDETEDPDLLEYYLYEIHALGAKHTYLLRQMKELEKEERP